MASFKGQAEYSVDSKGRVAIPAKMRNDMNPEAKGTFVITRGFEKCIFLYPLDYWTTIEEKIGTLNMFKAESRDFVRVMMRWAEESVLDVQGRVMIPKPLIEYAGISERVTIIGAFDHIEIWDPAACDQHLARQDEEFESLAERVMTS